MSRKQPSKYDELRIACASILAWTIIAGVTAFLIPSAIGNPEAAKGVIGTPTILLAILCILCPLVLLLSLTNWFTRRTSTFDGHTVVAVLVRTHFALIVASLVLQEIAIVVSGPPQRWDQLGMFLARALGLIVFLLSLPGAALTLFLTDRELAPLVGCSVFFGVMVGTIIGLTVWSHSLPNLVYGEVVKTADGQPYCVLTAGKPAETLYDLKGFDMLFRMRFFGSSATYYGLLIVEDYDGGLSYWNWSFQTARFEPTQRLFGVGNDGGCTPEPNSLWN